MSLMVVKLYAYECGMTCIMQTYYPEFYNANHITQKLKNTLEAHFGDNLEFWHQQQKCKSELVFSAKIDIGEAVELAFDYVHLKVRCWRMQLQYFGATSKMLSPLLVTCCGHHLLNI